MRVRCRRHPTRVPRPNRQYERRHLHSLLPRPEARKRARPPQAAARCGTGRGVPVRTPGARGEWRGGGQM